MNHAHAHNPRVLAVSPSGGGFGFAVLEGSDNLVDWGVKSVSTDSAAVILHMVHHFQAGAVVLEIKSSYQSAGIRLATKRVITMLEMNEIKVILLPREEVRKIFFPDGGGTGYGVAERVAEKFPEELGFRLPPKRVLWKGKDHRMGIFEAVALAVAAQKSSAR